MIFSVRSALDGSADVCESMPPVIASKSLRRFCKCAPTYRPPLRWFLRWYDLEYSNSWPQQINNHQVQL